MMYDKIILISLDSLRNDCLKLSGVNRYKDLYKKTTQPDIDILDEIGKNGVYFKNCYSAAPYTGASHGAIFSGKWPINNGLYEIYNKPIQSKIIFEYFKKKGFDTFLNTDFPFIIGTYLGLNKGVDGYFVEDEMAMIKKIKKGKNALAFFHFGGIHYPYGFHKYKFGKKDYLEKIRYLEKLYNIRNQPFSDKLVESYYDKKDLTLLMKYKRIITVLYDEKKYEELFNLYLEGIGYFLKNRFLRFREALMKKVEKENYLIVIFSDHGEERSDQCFGHHNNLGDGILNVPLIFLAKDIKPCIIDNVTKTIDILPTILELNNIKYNKMDGTSLHNSIKGKKIADRDTPLYAQMRGVKGTEDFEKLKKVRNDMINKDIRRKNISHILKKERISVGKFTLMNEYSQGILISQKLFTIDGNGKKKEVLDKQKNIYLNKLLQRYNRSTTNPTKSTKKPKDDIKLLLKNLGYNI